MTASRTIQTTTEKPLIRAVLQALWPAFFAAGILVAVLFSTIDPLSIAFVQNNLNNSREAAYTVVFLLTWIIISSACATTLLLASR